MDSLCDMENEPCLQSSHRKATVSKCSDDVAPSGGETRANRMAGPDSGWAWVVASAACAINLVMAGLGRMSGILFVAFIELYGVDRKGASAPFSVRSSIRNLMGPVVGILGQKYGARSVTIIGGVASTLSAVACFFAQDMVWITVLWGGLGGIGSALTVTLPQVTIGQYFDKHRTTASGMAFSGGCVGSFLFPVLLEFLLHSYGIQGTFLIIAAIIAHTIPAAMILRKPSWMKRPKNLDYLSVVATPALDEMVKTTEGNEVAVRKVGRDFTPLRNSLGKEESCPDIGFLKQNNDTIVKMILVDSELSASLEINQNHPTPAMEACVLGEIEEMYSNVQFSRGKSQFYKNLALVKKSLFREVVGKDKISICNQNNRSFKMDNSRKDGTCKTQSVPDISKITNDISRNHVMMKLKELLSMDLNRVSSWFPEQNTENLEKVLSELLKLYNANSRLVEVAIPIESETSVEKVPPKEVHTEEEEHSNSFFEHIKTAFRLHTNPLFLMVCLCRAVHFVTFIPVMTIVVDFVMDKGLQEHDGKYAIAALSLGDLMGRLCLGWVTDRGYMTLPKYMMVIMVIQGASTASLPMMNTKVTLYITLAVFGMLQGSLFVRHPVLVSKYMGSHEQSIAMGCINFFSGFLGFGLPHYIGYFRDTMGSYSYIFYINGSFGATVGLLWSLEPYFVKFISTKNQEKNVMQEPV